MGDDPELDTQESELQLPPPTNLTVTNLNTTQQRLSWDPSPGATKYVIRRGLAPGAETNYTEWPGPPFTADHLTPGTQYCWVVQNVSSTGGRSLSSNEVCLTTPGATALQPPATVTATPTSASRITVSWSAATGATKYIVNQSINGGAYAVAGNVSAPATTLDLAGLSAGTNYCYTVQSFATGETSLASSPPACTLTPLAGVEGYWKFDETSGTTATDSSGLGRAITLSGGAAFSMQNKAPINDNVAVLTTGTATTSVATTPSVGAYRLNLTSFAVAFWVRIPNTPTTTRIIGMRDANTCGAGTLGWEITQDATGLQFMGQNRTVAFGQSIAQGVWTHVAASYDTGTLHLYLNGTEVASSAYTASNSLQLPVAIGHPGGCAGDAVNVDELQFYSRSLSSTEVSTLGTLPPSPTNLRITSQGSTFVKLAWDAVPNASAYIIMRGTAAGNEVFLTHTANVTTYTGDHLTPGTQYSYEVRAVVNNLYGPVSNEIVTTTDAAPAAPMNVMATATSNTRITVSWDAVATARKYYVFQSINGGAYAPKGSVLAPGTNIVEANLTPNTPYCYEVQAEDTGLTKSPMSAPACTSTPN